MTHEELANELFRVANEHGNKLELSSATALIYLIGAIIKTHQEDAMIALLHTSDPAFGKYLSEALAKRK